MVGSLIGVVVYVAAYLLSQGGTVYAVSELYLGRTTTIGESLRRMRGQALNLFGVTLLNGLAILVGFVLLANRELEYSAPRGPRGDWRPPHLALAIRLNLASLFNSTMGSTQGRTLRQYANGSAGLKSAGKRECSEYDFEQFHPQQVVGLGNERSSNRHFRLEIGATY